MLARRQHGDHEIGIGRCGLGGGGGVAALGTGGFQGLGSQVEGPHLKTGFHEIGCHGAAHITQADEGYAGHIVILVEIGQQSIE